MRYPMLSGVNKRHEGTFEFRGLNLSPKTRQGEFFRLVNISLDKYPNMSVRKLRGKIATLTDGAVIGGNNSGVAWIDNGKLYYNGQAIDGLPIINVQANTQITAFGAYLLVTPDNLYYNTINPADKGTMAVSNASTGSVQYLLSRRDGVDYSTENMTVSASAPDNPANGDYWINTSGDTDILMQYSELSGAWAQIPTVYTKIKATGIGAGLKEYDGVKISGVAAASGTDPRLASELGELNGSKIVYGASDDYIIVVGILRSVYTQTSGTVTIKRDIPTMDYVCVSQNRLWGCRYGQQGADGNIVNEIYASKLGDFKNFAVFMGVSTDSYAAGVGQDGNFTGAVNHLGYPLFFKESCIYKVYGNQPKNFQINDTVCAGVKDGAHRSMAIVNETLYYLNRNGEFVGYDGAMPYSVSMAFADKRFNSAVSGQYINYYYTAAKAEGDTQATIYVFDTKRMLWTSEDSGDIKGFYTSGGEIYAIIDGAVYAMNGKAGTVKNEAIEWIAESGVFGWDNPEQKYTQRFNLRIKTGQTKYTDEQPPKPIEQRIELFIEYDSSGEWEKQGSEGYGSSRRGTLMIPVRPRRCDHYRIRISGTSEIEVYSIDFLGMTGGDGRGYI